MKCRSRSCVFVMTNLRALGLALVSLVAVSCCVATHDARVVLETDAPLTPPSGWTLLGSASPHTTIPLYFMLTQRNMDHVEGVLRNVSDPDSPEYGRYLSATELSSLVRPSEIGVGVIRDWLRDSGDGDADVHLSGHGDILFAPRVAVSVAERLFGTRMMTYRHAGSGQIRVRAATPYSVPAHVASFVDLVGGLTGFGGLRGSVVTASQESLEALSPLRDGSPLVIDIICGPEECSMFSKIFCLNGSTTASVSAPCSDHGRALAGFTLRVGPLNPIGGATSVVHDVPFSAMDCLLNNSIVFCYTPFRLSDVQMDVYGMYSVESRSSFVGGKKSPFVKFRTPVMPAPFATMRFLRERYGIPEGMTATTDGNSQGVAEFFEQYFNNDDLNKFLELNGEPPIGPVAVKGFNDPNHVLAEAVLDVQYIALARGVPTEFWSIPGRNNFHQEPFLEWAVAVQDAGGGPLVHSISYGDDENTLSSDYMKRVCDEFKKLGAIGRTVLVSSGDDGVGGTVFRAHPDKGCGQSVPTFPATCPYVTSVGATQVSTDFQPICLQSMGGMRYGCSDVGEIVASSATGARITSGGGFSRVFSRPDYQDSMVQTYLKGTVPPSSFFNRDGRGFPDVAALGHNYPIYIPFYSVLKGTSNPNQRVVVTVDGTSASTPVVAAMISMLNDIRLANNEPSMGFINPWLYAMAKSHPEAFRDVVLGDNKCAARHNASGPLPCCPHGFEARPAWDAVTGLGTPVFPVWANAVANPKARFPLVGVQGPPGPVGPQGTATTSIGERVSLWIFVSILVLVSGAVLVLVVKTRKEAKDAADDRMSQEPLIDAKL